MIKNLYILLLLFIFSSCGTAGDRKYADFNTFPAFKASSGNVSISRLNAKDEDICRVYVSRNKERLIVIAKLNPDVNGTKAKQYRFTVYDQHLQSILKIEAPELDGLFGLDNIGNIYAGKGYFNHYTYQYKPIEQLLVTDKPTTGKPLEINLKTLSKMPQRGDTLLSFIRKDYKGSFYYMKKSGTVYQVLFKDCSYCEPDFNQGRSISEYSAEENGTEKVMKPFDKRSNGWFQQGATYYYKLQLAKDSITFKIRYTDESIYNQIRKIDFANKVLFVYKPDNHQIRSLYFGTSDPIKSK